MASVLLVEEGGVGGVADYTHQLASALAESSWTVCLATARDHDAPLPASVKVYRLYPYVRGRSLLGRLIRRARLSRLTNGIGHLAAAIAIAALSRRFDVVHLQGEEWPPLGALQALLIRMSRRPIVYTPHNTFSRDAAQHLWASALIRRCATRIVVHSNFDTQVLSASEARKSVVIPHGEYGALVANPCDADRGSARSAAGVADDELAVLLFGQLRPDKGVRDLLLAAERTPGITVLLAGEEKGALAECVHLLGSPRLRSRTLVTEGFIGPTQMASLFAACDVVAVPYLRASASGVLLLAYAFKRPVVAYPTGGLPEYVLDGRTGWLCERPTAESLASCMSDIRSSGRAECAARGLEAWSYSRERFGWGQIAQQTIALYREAVSAATPGHGTTARPQCPG